MLPSGSSFDGKHQRCGLSEHLSPTLFPEHTLDERAEQETAAGFVRSGLVVASLSGDSTPQAAKAKTTQIANFFTIVLSLIARDMARGNERTQTCYAII